MTELFLNGQPAVLSENLNIKVVRDNPYFTKSGSYTHNIALPLEGCAQNARIFEHIHRADRSKPTDRTLSARLVSDNIVLIAGTATILEISEKQVQIQILSGNAEMNFFERMKNQYIDQFLLGNLRLIGEGRPVTTYVYTQDKWGAYAYPDIPHVQIPVYNENDGKAYYEVRDRNNKKSYATYGLQPYLCAVIRFIVQALGYTLEYNALENTYFRNLIICNADYGTRSYAACLPHWTVSEFFSQLENTFGLVVNINEENGLFRLDAVSDFVSLDKSVYLDVLDEFTCKIEEEKQSQGIATSNIGYMLSDSDMHRYKQVPREVLESATVQEFASTAAMNAAWNTIANKGAKLFKVGARKFIAWMDDKNNVKPLEIDQYGMLTGNPDSENTDIELKIVPVGIRYCEAADVTDNVYPIQVPSLQGKPYTTKQSIRPGTVSVGAMQEAVENGGIIKEDKSDLMQVAFYVGRQTVHGVDWGEGERAPQAKAIQYPIAWTDCLDMIVPGLQLPNWSLRLNGDDTFNCLGSEVFRNLVKVNTRIEEKKRFIYAGIPDVRTVFVAAGRLFLCKQIEITVTATGMEKVMEATLYEMEG